MFVGCKTGITLAMKMVAMASLEGCCCCSEMDRSAVFVHDNSVGQIHGRHVLSAHINNERKQAKHVHAWRSEYFHDNSKDAALEFQERHETSLFTHTHTYTLTGTVWAAV